MNAVIISIGDELLIGQVVNSNAAFIAERLNSVGIDVDRILTIGDTEASILAGLTESHADADLVVITGGLGPTHDDITRTAVCAYFHTDLISSDEARNHILEFLKMRQRPWSDAAENQTLIPRGAEVIPNSHGTAPGEFFHREGKYTIVMPGVPREMTAMMDEFVVPYFTKHHSGNVILHQTLNTAGIPESLLAERLGSLEDLLQGEKLAFLPSTAGVRLRITVKGRDASTCRQKLQRIEQQIRSRAGKYVYGVGDVSLEGVLGELLAGRELTIAVAESCTGGLVADSLTNVPGSSRYFKHGVVAYSNRSKVALLKVPEDLLAHHGAVSKEVAEAMAIGVRSIENADIGISTTGIAGPAGGTDEKPVGLVWIGYSDNEGALAKKFNFGNDRISIKERASTAALELIRRRILKIDG